MFSRQVRPRQIDERREQAPARPDQRRDRQPEGPAAPAALHPPAALATTAHGPCLRLRQEIQLLSTRFVITCPYVTLSRIVNNVMSLDRWSVHKFELTHTTLIMYLLIAREHIYLKTT